MNSPQQNLIRVRQLRHSQKGEGAFVIYLIVFAILCSIFYFVTGWIYEEKESRVQRSMDQSNKRRGRGVDEKALRPKRDILGYKVIYGGDGSIRGMKNLNPAEVYPY